MTLQDKKPPFQDLYLCFCGRSICQPDHSIGPAAHPNYVLHYILEGKGEYRINNHVYSLSAGQGFLMKPNIMSSYKADHITPWKYLWIGFDGSYAKELLSQIGLSSRTLTFSANCGDKLLEVINRMLECDADGISYHLYLQTQLYVFFYHLSQVLSVKSNKLHTGQQNYYIRMAEEFVEKYYAQNIHVQDIADYVGICRSHLTTLFQDNLQMSPSEYITHFRLTRAHEQLAISNFSIGKIAEICGYQDPLVFSRAFKKMTGMTPTQYRRIRQEEYHLSIEKIRKKK